MKKDPNSAVQAENRRLAAIMFTDIVGFSRQMGANEARTLRLLEIHNQIIQQAVTEHHGHVIKSTGDGFLVEFPSVVHAVQCAQRIHIELRAYNSEKETAEQIHIRIGIHLGDIVVQQDGDVQGDGVNIAARLQPLAEPDTICISHKVYEEVAKKISLGTVVSLRRPKLKNIAERFQVYALLSEPPKGLRQTLQAQWLKLSRRVGTAHRVVAVVGVLAVVSAGTLVIKNRYFPTYPGLPLPDKPSIAVLPFANMSGDPEQEYFSDGMTDTLITDLSKLAGLFVIARNSVFTYKGQAVNVGEVSRKLGVRYVLEGSIQKAEDRVRINVQLVDAITAGHVWTERYDRQLKDIFALQDEVVHRIVAALELSLEQGLQMRRTTDNLEAYDYYLRGVAQYFRFTQELNKQARRMFERALEVDPEYAEAYAALGATYALERLWQWSQDPQTLERAFELARRAIALDDSLPRAHMLLSQLYLMKQQYDQAMAEAKRALALDPNNADGYVILAEVLSFTGRPEQALGLVEKAMRLDPRHPDFYLTTLGLAYRYAGRSEEAIAPLKKVITTYPNHLYAHLHLAALYTELGREEEALAEATEVLRINPNFNLEGLKESPYKDPATLVRALEVTRSPPTGFIAAFRDIYGVPQVLERKSGLE